MPTKKELFEALDRAETLLRETEHALHLADSDLRTHPILGTALLQLVLGDLRYKAQMAGYELKPLLDKLSKEI